MEKIGSQLEMAKADSEGAGKAPVANQEAVDYFERHRELFEHYARGAVKIEPAPVGLDTFAFDLKTNTIYVNDSINKGRNLSEEKITFATLHEIEHFSEKVATLREKGGEAAFKKYLDRLEKDRAYSLMDNCVSDVRENRTVVGKTHQGFREVEQRLYKEDAFSSTDLTNSPSHIQLAEALLREARVPDEVCQVAPEVRARLDQLRAVESGGVSLFEVMTHPDTPMSVRLKLQDKYLWPLVKELRDEDMKKEKEKKEKEEGKGEKGEEKDENGQGGEDQEGDKAEAGEGEPKSSGKPGDKKGKEGKGGGEPDPNEVFKDAYDEADKKMPHAVPLGDLKKAFEDYQKEKKDDPLARADKEYAQKIGVKPEDLKRYRNIVEALEQVKDPETQKNVVEELRALFARILSGRRKPVGMPKYPTEEGDDIVDPATLVAEVKGGNLTPKVWETVEVKEIKGQKFGEVELTLVCDRSGSMAGGKCAEQQKAGVLFMEALKELADICEGEKVNMDKPLEVRSEIYTFQASSADSIPAKKMSKDLSEKERVEAAALLGSAPGRSTTDFVSLQAIIRSMTETDKRKIKEGELKKIVLVFTDGESDNPEEVKAALRVLRGAGVVVVGVGITEEGRAALTTYAPEARLAETADRLPGVLGDLLKEHLSGV